MHSNSIYAAFQPSLFEFTWQQDKMATSTPSVRKSTRQRGARFNLSEVCAMLEDSSDEDISDSSGSDIDLHEFDTSSTTSSENSDGDGADDTVSHSATDTDSRSTAQNTDTCVQGEHEVRLLNGNITTCLLLYMLYQFTNVLDSYSV